MKKDSFLKNKFALALVVFLTVLVVARLLLLNQYPLIGTTEPRYAELARKMLVMGDWVTLWVSDGVPLWGKPPLLFWLDAMSMSVLGINEFALRLPTFIASLIVLGLFWFWPAKAEQSAPKNTLFALVACLIYFSTPFGFFAAGFVATDIFLTLGLTLSMLGFWSAIQAPAAKSWQRLWPWAFFVGMAIGLLAKGPLALVLLGLALFVWMLWSPKARLLLIWKSLPWTRGLLLMAVLAFPWYILHEIRTPGFLNHFIIGEHFERFFVKDWAGGRFAPSHGEPLGMIWWFAIEAFMPWLVLSIPAIYMAMKRQSSARIIATMSHETQYLLGWIAAPLLLFTPSRNILEAYMLTALPAFAILTSRLWLDLIERNSNWQRGIYLAIPAPLVVVVAVMFFNPVLDEQSQKHILQNWQTGTPIVYIGKVPPSAAFYTRNQATDSPSFAAFEAALLAKPSPEPTTVVMHHTEFDTMTASQKQQWKLVETYGDYVMLRK
jgi:4-amino-4-deoxy-L-arabinose transferase-like glycosyltransferase